MRPDARVQSAIEILDQWRQGETGADRILMNWARGNRYAGSKDRAAIADHVYDALRRMRSAAWVAGAPEPASGRALMLGSALLDDQKTEALFTGARHAPEPLSETEEAARQSLEDAPRAIRLDYPDWLDPFLADVDDRNLAVLRNRAAVDLRVNTLKANLQQAVDVLAEDGIQANALPNFPKALRVVEGARRVNRSRAYDQGLIEIQDAGSQGLSELADAQPGELILDLCAGGGGKSLALAASANGGARILAHDISAQRLTDLPARAERAGAAIEIVTSNSLNSFKGKADLVFVDAPCTGSGAWRRNPDAKWQLTDQRLQELVDIQAGLLRQATELCGSSGRIVYGTCSLLHIENQAQIDAFLAETLQWQQVRTYEALPADGTDGFFGAVLTR